MRDLHVRGLVNDVEEHHLGALKIRAFLEVNIALVLDDEMARLGDHADHEHILIKLGWRDRLGAKRGEQLTVAHVTFVKRQTTGDGDFLQLGVAVRLVIAGEPNFLERDAEVTQPGEAAITMARLVPEVAGDVLVPFPRHMVAVVDPAELVVGEVFLEHVAEGPEEAARL